MESHLCKTGHRTEEGVGDDEADTVALNTLADQCCQWLATIFHQLGGD